MKMLPDVDEIYFPLVMKTWVVNRAALLRRLADKNLNVRQPGYKSDHDKEARFGAACAPGDYLFVDRPLSTISAAKRLVAERYPKLIPKRHGPYHVLNVGPKFPKVLEDGVENSVSIDCVLRVTKENDALDQTLEKLTDPNKQVANPQIIRKSTRRCSSML